MSQRKRSDKPQPKPLRPLHQQAPILSILNPNAAGIDVHSDMHMVCVPVASVVPSASSEAGGLPANVRRFGANSCDLVAIAAWLKECGVTTVAMESTGVYWIPLYELLESRGFEVWLVEPGQLSRCGARPKTDVLDVQWIQRLHSYGLLQPSFRPPDSIMALRAYHRQRQMQIRYAASHTQHMQKALEQMNVKLTEVVSDITGLTGRHRWRHQLPPSPDDPRGAAPRPGNALPTPVCAGELRRTPVRQSVALHRCALPARAHALEQLCRALADHPYLLPARARPHASSFGRASGGDCATPIASSPRPLSTSACTTTSARCMGRT
jgi:hypothetical protein